MKTIRNSALGLLASAILGLMATACSGRDNFKLEVEVDGLGTQSINLYFYTRAGLKSVSIPAVDGRMEYTSSSKEPVLIELTTGGRRTIGFLMAQNGQTVKAFYRPGDSSATEVSGNKTSKRIAEFYAANAALVDSVGGPQLNEAIGRYIAANPADEVSAILLSRLYDATIDPAEANRLLHSIDPSVRTASIMAGMSELINVFPDSAATTLAPLRLYCGDSVRTVAPRDTLGLILAIHSPMGSAAHDTVAARLNAAYDTLRKRVVMAELMTAADTVEWRAQIDSVAPRYTYGWLPGGIATPSLRGMNIKALPTFIAADSTGRILYRGPSLPQAIEQLFSAD